LSTSNINCRKCKKPVAVKHHSGRLRVCEGVMVVVRKLAIELTCVCGVKRIVTNG
jgi:hypothetical protein